VEKWKKKRSGCVFLLGCFCSGRIWRCVDSY